MLFIDASGDGNFEKGKNQNILRDSDIERIIGTYRKREAVDKYSYVAAKEEIVENDYNLNIPRYVDTFEEEAPIDIDVVKADIAATEKEIAEVQAKMDEFLKEIRVKKEKYTYNLIYEVFKTLQKIFIIIKNKKLQL